MSDFIPEDFIQKVLEDSDIVSLVDSYVPLKRKGKDHWAHSVSYTHIRAHETGRNGECRLLL